jgi:hypothetical protein
VGELLGRLSTLWTMKLHGLSDWLPRDGEPPLFGVERTGGDFLGRPDDRSWLRRVLDYIGRWLRGNL